MLRRCRAAEIHAPNQPSTAPAPSSTAMSSGARPAQRITAAVQPRQGRHRLGQHHDDERDDSPGEQRAAEAVEDPGIQERPAHERVRAADQLGDLDLGAAAGDLQTDGIADHRQHADSQQRCGDDQQPAQHLEYRVEAHDPLGVDLHHIDLGPGAEVAAQRFQRRGRAVFGARAHVQHVRQRVVLERRQRIAEARISAEVLQPLVGGDEA